MKPRNFVSGDNTDRIKLTDVEGRRPAVHRRPVVWLLASAMAVLGAVDELSAERLKSSTSSADRHKPASGSSAEHSKTASTSPAEHRKSSSHHKKSADAEHHKDAEHRKEAEHHKGAEHHRRVIAQPEDGDGAGAPLPPDLAAAKEANELVRQGKVKEATALAASIGDPVAAKLVEWALLRHSDSPAGFERYVAFMRANPDWPSIPLLRRRAEARLWQERRDGATVRRFVGKEPVSAAGRLALARVEMGEGDRAGAESTVRAVWQSEPLSAELETAVLAAFPDMLTRADHVARMDRRIGAKDFGAATRAAKHVGEDYVAIVKACAAAEAKAAKGGALLDGIHADAREDLGYALCRVHWLLRNDTPGSNLHGRVVTPKGDLAAAAKLVLAASPEDLQRQDTDEWWRDERALARKLLDIGEAATAYQVVSHAAAPANPYYRAEFHHMAGWIALRFLADPATALAHFAHADEGITDPVPVARAAYWRGRAAEAAGRLGDMRTQYQAAARYPTAYYGQLARARLGLDDVVELRAPPAPADVNTSEVLRAADMLYRIGEGDLVLSFVSDLAQESSDPAVIAGVGQLTARYRDAQAMLLVGKNALARGLPMDVYAYPDIGVPNFSPVGPKLDRCIVYSIVRTESGFDQGDMSAAKAAGLMQVTPSAARDTAKRFGASYDWKRLVSDPIYNTQMGAAEISGLLKDYRGSYILTFAGYNAGRGRVEQWMAQHGDPRDPKIDAVDWVERIPFSETRNYVQRVMENLQVYRKRFGEGTATIEPNLHRGAAAEQAVPARVELSMPH
ncbi:MAG TPA: lytic transglycosylase domain-containing protein [Xanthobacteraceae bacterium]|jgi:soluble lytic murein transglycosylase|nr:lytic transglycosylase domain-containing protein [Xanthobacteraceae bacterium]